MLLFNLGDKGTGKSRLLRQLAWGRLERFPTCSVLVHDPNDQWAKGKAFTNAAAVRAHLKKHGTIPRLTLIKRDTPHRVARLAWDVGTTTCVIDELDTVCTTKSWSQEEWIDEVECGAARALAHYGRHRGVDLWGGFRFTRNVNEDLPGLADFIFLFRHNDAAMADLELLRRRFNPAVADAVLEMEDHECIVWAGSR